MLGGIYTGDWVYLSLENAKLIKGAIVAVGITEHPLIEILDTHISKLEGTDGLATTVRKGVEG